jgi:hypothetical protein
MNDFAVFEELKLSRNKILYDPVYSELLNIIQSVLPIFSGRVFVIDHIVEQEADLLTLLINGDKIIEIEMSRESSIENPVNLEIIALKDYSKQSKCFSKITRRRLEAAIKLSKV